MHKFKREIFATESFSYEEVHKKKCDRRSINHVAPAVLGLEETRRRSGEGEARAFYIAKFSPLVKTVGYKKRREGLLSNRIDRRVASDESRAAGTMWSVDFYRQSRRRPRLYSGTEAPSSRPPRYMHVWILFPRNSTLSPSPSVPLPRVPTTNSMMENYSGLRELAPSG